MSNKTPMENGTGNETGNAVVDQAVHWFTLMNDPALASQYQNEFNVWYTRSETNRKAYKGIVSLWDKSGFTDSAVNYVSPAVFPQASKASDKRGNRVFSATLALAATVVIAVLLQVSFTNQSSVNSAEPVTYITAVAETKEVMLADGSRLTMGPGSEVTFAHTDQLRSATLVAGRAFFDVMKNPDLPFVVENGKNTVEVTGTEFEVSHFLDQTQVSVVEGSVSVSGQDASGYTLNLKAGERIQAAYSGERVSEITSFSERDALSWMKNRLVFGNTPMDEFFARIQPYIEDTIVANDERIALLSINTIVKTDNVESVLESLPAAYPLSMQRSDGQIFVTYTQQN